MTLVDANLKAFVWFISIKGSLVRVAIVYHIKWKLIRLDLF